MKRFAIDVTAQRLSVRWHALAISREAEKLVTSERVPPPFPVARRRRSSSPRLNKVRALTRLRSPRARGAAGNRAFRTGEREVHVSDASPAAAAAYPQQWRRS